MSLTGAIVLYATLWFLVMFLLLPFGHRSQDEAGEIVPGTPAGAPSTLDVRRKVIWCTLLTTILFAGIVWVIQSGWITRADMMEFGRFDR